MEFYYKRIWDLREDNDKTQKNIADYLNISQQQYQLYESGKREIPLHLIIMLANLYDVTLDYIIGRSDIKRIIKWIVLKNTLKKYIIDLITH